MRTVPTPFASFAMPIPSVLPILPILPNDARFD